MNPPQVPPKKRGCFFYGCITAVCLAVAVCVIGFFGFRYAINYMNRMIMEYTEDAPMALPKLDMPQAELDKLKDRAAAFGNALDAHTNTPPLVLTGREITALLADMPALKTNNLGNKFYFEIESNQIKGLISLPLGEYNQIPLLKTQGRYLNGEAGFGVGVTNGALTVTIKSMQVKGKPVPDQFLKQLQDTEQKDINQNVNNDPTNQSALRNLESLEVKDGTLILKAKQP